jgi:hypothetical protein
MHELQAVEGNTEVPMHRRRTTCRGCGGDQLRAFLELGPMPLANAFLRSPEEFAAELRFPLDVFHCAGCSLVQLLDVINPEVLFRNYLYQTGMSETMAAHNARLAQMLVELLGLGSRDLVVEVASNDGSLLRCFQAHQVRTLGVEPATNLARCAAAEGIETINAFFSSTTAQAIRETHGPARVVIGNNVLAHVDEPADFLRGFRLLLRSDGLAVFEVPYLGELVERLEYDTIYHEHLSYFSVTELLRLCEASGLSIIRIDRVSVHGGSLRVFTAGTVHSRDHAADVLAWADQEKAAGLTSLPRFERFAAAVRRSRDRLQEALQSFHDRGGMVAGYGASAKGNTLLNYCGIGPDLVPFLVDKNPLKVGRYTPGTHLPVLPVETLLERQPGGVLILAWNLADEIMRQQHEYRRRGGTFLLPIPEPRWV